MLLSYIFILHLTRIVPILQLYRKPKKQNLSQICCTNSNMTNCSASWYSTVVFQYYMLFLRNITKKLVRINCRRWTLLIGHIGSCRHDLQAEFYWFKQRVKSQSFSQLVSWELQLSNRLQNLSHKCQLICTQLLLTCNFSKGAKSWAIS